MHGRIGWSAVALNTTLAVTVFLWLIILTIWANSKINRLEKKTGIDT